MMKKTILFYLLVILFLASCSDDSRDGLEEEQTQVIPEEKLKYESEIIKKIDGNIYLLNSNSKEGEVRIKFHSTYNNEQRFVGIFKGDLIQIDMEGIKYVDSVSLPLVLSWDTLQQLSPSFNGYTRKNSFKILNDSCIVGLQDYVKGNWMKK